MKSFLFDFSERPNCSTGTNASGQAGLRYRYGTTKGTNKVQVSVSGDPSVTPVEFTLTGYFPVIKILPLDVAKVNDNYKVYGPSNALGDVIKVKVIDPRKSELLLQVKDLLSKPTADKKDNAPKASKQSIK